MKFPKFDSYKNRGKFLGWGTGANTDWRIMFTLFSILALATTFYCVYFFVAVREETREASIASQDLPVDTAALRRTAEFYSKQKENFETFRTVPETTPDPSI